MSFNPFQINLRPLIPTQEQIQQNIANLQQQQNANTLLAQLATQLQNQQQQQQHKKQPSPGYPRKTLSSSKTHASNASPSQRQTFRFGKKEHSKSPTPNTLKKTRLSCKIPKYSINNQRALTHIDLRNRYASLYIPNELVLCKYLWLDCLPLDKPLKLNHHCSYFIMKKEAKPLNSSVITYESLDESKLWQVKVMLISIPGVNEAQDEHQLKLIQFLVGSHANSNLFALGGKWSCSLDGPNPSTNPQTLINTAVRSIKALTNIDLSLCTKWYRFLEIQYEVNDTIETNVFFMVNVWNCMPNSVEYEKIVESYARLIDNPKFGQEVASISIKSEPIDDQDLILLSEPPRQCLITLNDNVKCEEVSTRDEREKLYRLPSQPHILVHPSNKTDCQLVRLHSLLNTRGSNELASFELNLFAECFNDMLIRDHAYAIYKALLKYSQQETILRKSSDEQQQQQVKQSKLDESCKWIKPKNYIKSEIFMAFLFFDTNRNGYLFDKDLEDILMCLGLNFTSRAKLKTILCKLQFNKDTSFNYRSFCEQLNHDECASILGVCNITAGNNCAKPTALSFTNTSGLIELNGMTIDIVSTLKQLEKSESNYYELETRLKESHIEIEKLKVNLDSSEKSKELLKDDLLKYKKKLNDEQRKIKDTEEKLKFFRDFHNKSKYHLDKLNEHFDYLNKKTSIVGSNKISLGNGTEECTNHPVINNNNESNGST